MKSIVIYHNPNCSKSRAACEFIAAQGLGAEVVEYLRTPLGLEELRSLLRKLGLRPADIVRKGEEVYQQQYADRSLTDEECLEALVAHPILIERPIVVCGDKAVLARPAERILDLL